MTILYAWQTPNCLKVLLLLEELDTCPYILRPVHLGLGKHLTAEFRSLTPNSKVPVLEHTALKKPLFESGAILWFLAQTYGAFLPKNIEEQTQVHAWLMWQMSALGPMVHECFHARAGSKLPQPYSVQRFSRECTRLFGVLNQHLQRTPYMVESYGIADMAIYPWIRISERIGLKLKPFPYVQAWYQRIEGREKTVKAQQVLADISEDGAGEGNRTLI